MFVSLTRPRRTIEVFLIVSAITLIAYGISFGLVLPLERALIDRPNAQSIVLFLPHGVKIIAAWMLGWWSVPLLLPGVVLSNLLIVEKSALNPTDLALGAVGLLTSPLAFELFRWAGFDLRARNGLRVRWRALLLVGFVASVLNVIPVYIASSRPPGLHAEIYGVSRTLLGDTLGVVAVLLVAMLVFRWSRRHPR